MTSDFKYKWFGTFQRKTMKKNILVRSRTFWIALERSFEIPVFVCKQSEFRLFLIVVERSETFQNILERSLAFQNVLFHCYLQTFQGQLIGDSLERSGTFHIQIFLLEQSQSKNRSYR